MKIQYGVPVAMFIGVLGIAILVISFFSPLFELQLAMFMAAVSIICVGIILWGQAQEKKQQAEKLEKLMEKLEKLEKMGEKLEKLDQPRNTGVAIADVISSGLKYYTEHMSQQKDDKDD